MLILSCILILKHWWMKYRWLSAVLVVAILLLLLFLIRKVCIYFWVIEKKDKNSEEWINISEFSNILELNKEWKLQSYPIVTLLSDVDGEVVSINVSTWDIVDEYDILMQIRDINGQNSDYDDVDEMMNVMYDNYKDLEREYNEFQMQYWDKIKNLENQLFNSQNSLIQAMELNDIEWKKILENQINDINLELSTLKIQQESLEYWVKDLESQIQMIRNESDKLYFQQEKQTPRAPFKWVIWNIYVWEWEYIKNWQEVITIINNNYTPEISVSLDFNEYILTKDLTWVIIILENENWWDFEYNWEIYTRSPILNNEWKYTVTIKIIDEVSDLILSDDNTKINVIFSVNSDLIWVPDRCFKKIKKTNWILSLYDGYFVEDKEIEIKYKWNGWNNISNLWLYSLEKDEKKDGIETGTIQVLCDSE